MSLHSMLLDMLLSIIPIGLFLIYMVGCGLLTAWISSEKKHDNNTVNDAFWLGFFFTGLAVLYAVFILEDISDRPARYTSTSPSSPWIPSPDLPPKTLAYDNMSPHNLPVHHIDSPSYILYVSGDVDMFGYPTKD